MIGLLRLDHVDRSKPIRLRQMLRFTTARCYFRTMRYYRSKTRKYGLYFRVETVEYKNKESFKKKEFIAKLTNSDNKVKIIQKI